MASFSTIPEQTPLLDEARPKQRKFAATTVAVLCLASAAVAASVPAVRRAMTLDSSDNTWGNEKAYFQMKGTNSCLGVKNHNKATVGSPLVIYTCDDSKHIGQEFLYEQTNDMGHIKYQTTAGDWLCVTAWGTDDDTAPTPPAATAGKRFVLKTCGSPTWDSQNILYMHAPEYNANLKMAQDNFEGNLCLAATGSVNEDVIETAICDGNDKYQAWQLKVIEELPQHLDDEYGGH
mmetsp:Transcript_6416/g.18028  ORF Transcript_6416/g.18028 Transcript_6416/m.18028 type:complete len:234 (-) Transcript_6416:241-942(-)